ncbi:Myb/SANT-like domain containing protein, partial [Trema orientale]
MGNKVKRNNEDKRFNVKWTERWDDVFVEALVHQQSMGNRVDKVFTSAAYNNIVKEMRDRLGEPFQKDHLKNRMKTLKLHFKECYNLFGGINDFTWSPETKLWTADPEVWKDLISARPDARKWMFTPIGNYDKLLMLFANETSDSPVVVKDEANHCVNLNNSSNLDCGDHVTFQNEVAFTLEDLNGANGANDMLPTSAEANSQIDSQAPSLSATSSKGKKRKATKNFEFEREFASVREAIKDVAAAIREGNAIAERSRPRVYSEQDVFKELVNIGIDFQLRFRAYTFLIANAGRVRAFFGCPVDERK